MVELLLRVRDADGKLVMRATIDALWRRERRPESVRAPAANGREPELSPVSTDGVLI
jgi:hypothetical protein